MRTASIVGTLGSLTLRSGALMDADRPRGTGRAREAVAADPADHEGGDDGETCDEGQHPAASRGVGCRVFHARQVRGGRYDPAMDPPSVGDVAASQWDMASAKPAMPGVDAALRLLTFLAAQRGPVAAATVQRALGLPRSSTYKLLRALEDQGFVLRLPDEKRYGLGLAAFELSSGFSRQEPLTRIGAPLLARLVDRVGESAHLSVLHGRDVVYLIEERARNRPSLVTEVGVRLPADITASGRAMLALLPPAQLRALYPSDAAFASRTAPPLTYFRLKKVLDDTRRAGYATEDGDVTAGIASVAVGIADPAGWPVAAVAITFESVRPRPELVDAARDVAAELARAIRGSVPPVVE